MHFSNCVFVLLCFVVKQLLNNWMGAMAGLEGGMAGLAPWIRHWTLKYAQRTKN